MIMQVMKFDLRLLEGTISLLWVIIINNAGIWSSEAVKFWNACADLGGEVETCLEYFIYS